MSEPTSTPTPEAGAIDATTSGEGGAGASISGQVATVVDPPSTTPTTAETTAPDAPATPTASSSKDEGGASSSVVDVAGGSVGGGGGGGGDGDGDANASLTSEMDALRKMMDQFQKESDRMDTLSGSPSANPDTAGAKAKEMDERSVFVGNVDFSATAGELAEFFKSCGTIERCTILTDKFTKRRKGTAYIEFAEKSAVEHACVLNGETFKGRELKVLPKRTNTPFSMRGRGRGRGRGHFRGGYIGGFRPRGYRGGFRGRGRGYSPYG